MVNEIEKLNTRPTTMLATPSGLAGSVKEIGRLGRCPQCSSQSICFTIQQSWMGSKGVVAQGSSLSICFTHGRARGGRRVAGELHQDVDHASAPRREPHRNSTS